MDSLLEVMPSRSEIPRPEEGHATGIMSLDEETRILSVFGQGEQLLCQLLRRPEIPAGPIEIPQSVQHREEPRSFACS
jgi:hypothetical protein